MHAVLTCSLALSACESPSEPTAGAGVPAELEAAAGDGQVGVVGQELPVPVRVQVLDGRGDPVAGVSVVWETPEGQGTATPASTASDGAGVAATTWRLGSVAGAQALVARVEGVAPFTFSAQAAAAAPARIHLSASDLVLVLEEGRDEAQVEATVLDGFDNPVGTAVIWSVPDGMVAEVDATGRVRALGAGYSTVTARVGTVVGGLSLTVENPVPLLEGVAPAALTAGTGDTTLTLSGSGFMATSVVLWNGTPRPMTFVDASELRVEIAAADLAVEGTAAVQVLTATPGGGTTAPLTFIVEPRVPTVRITSDATTSTIGGWLDIGVEARDASGVRIQDPEIEWSWADNGLDGFLDGPRGGAVRLREIGTSRLVVEWIGVAVDTLEVLARGIDERVTDVDAGGGLTCGLDADGAAHCWGWHFMGFDPDGVFSYSSWTFAPAPVAGGRTFESLTVGNWHACGLDAAGSAWCWYSDNEGQLGDGNVPPGHGSVEPVPVAGGLRFRELMASGWHTCGITFQDEAWCWGANAYGQLGVGDQARRTGPVQVAGSTGFQQLFGGGWHTCALTPAGEAYCWGYNAYGQLGRDDSGTCDDVLYGQVPCAFTPGPVATQLRFASLAVGGSFTCGLTAAGEAYCWGAGTRGQLGDGVTGRSLAPIRVAGGHRFESIDAGHGHACGLIEAGEIWCWGQNDFGNNGVELHESETCIENNAGYDCNTRPVRVSGGQAFASVATGNYHTCGMTRGGRALCWGESSNGELGRGAAGEQYYEASPAPVFDGWMSAAAAAGLRNDGRPSWWSAERQPGGVDRTGAGSSGAAEATSHAAEARVR